MTFHYINNYGAILQAYALKKAIDGIDGYSAEIINYIPEDRVEWPYEFGEAGKKLMEEKLDRLYEFLWNTCDVKKEIVRRVDGDKYDYYCVGSDQVWNFEISGNDLTYLLKDLDKGAKKISYASSIGISEQKLFPHKEIYRELLSDFKALSVRELEHRDWIERELGLRCVTVLDPTFLISSDYYEKIMTKDELVDHPFMLFIWYMHDPDGLIKGIEFANTVSRKYGLPVIHNLVKIPEYMIAHEKKCMFYEGVEEFLWYIRHSDMIVTNSYHVTMFSIHFRRPFYSFISKSMRSRFDTVGKAFGIDNRFVEEYIEPDDINDEINYEEVYANIEPLRTESKEYLLAALDVR